MVLFGHKGHANIKGFTVSETLAKDESACLFYSFYLGWLNLSNTVKPFNLAALKVGDSACKIIFTPLILANYNHIIRNRPIAVDIRAL